MERTRKSNYIDWMTHGTIYCNFHVSQYIFIITVTDTLNSPEETGAAEVYGCSWRDDSAAGGPKYFNSESKMI